MWSRLDVDCLKKSFLGCLERLVPCQHHSCLYRFGVVVPLYCGSSMRIVVMGITLCIFGSLRPKFSCVVIGKPTKISLWLETTTMVDLLLLRLRGALHEVWLEDVPELRRAIIAGSSEFSGMRSVVT